MRLKLVKLPWSHLLGKMIKSKIFAFTLACLILSCFTYKFIYFILWMKILCLNVVIYVYFVTTLSLRKTSQLSSYGRIYRNGHRWSSRIHIVCDRMQFWSGTDLFIFNSYHLESIGATIAIKSAVLPEEIVKSFSVGISKLWSSYYHIHFHSIPSSSFPLCLYILHRCSYGFLSFFVPVYYMDLMNE